MLYVCLFVQMACWLAGCLCLCLYVCSHGWVAVCLCVCLSARSSVQLFLPFFRFPPKLRSMCHCLYQVVTQRFQQSSFDAVWTVIGTVIFLRYINPAIGKTGLLCIVVLGVVLSVLSPPPTPETQQCTTLISRPFAYETVTAEQFMHSL